MKATHPSDNNVLSQGRGEIRVIYTSYSAESVGTLYEIHFFL